jgi:hypothetical protein
MIAPESAAVPHGESGTAWLIKCLPAGSTTPAAATTATGTAPAATSATTTATTAPAAASATVTTTGAASRFGTCFVDIHSPAIQIGAVQFGNGCFRIATFSHFNESEASGLTGFPIGYDVDAFYATECRKSSV